MLSVKRATLTLHVVSSVDGFIVDKDTCVPWLDGPGIIYTKEVSDGSEETIDLIDCYVLGSRAYEPGRKVGAPYRVLPAVVMNNRELPSPGERVKVYSGDLDKLGADILAARYGHIWIAGQTLLAPSFLKLGLVDEIRLMISPVTLSAGLRRIGDSGPEQQWRLTNMAAHRNGLIELSYRR